MPLAARLFILIALLAGAAGVDYVVNKGRYTAEATREAMHFVREALHRVGL